VGLPMLDIEELDLYKLHIWDTPIRWCVTKCFVYG
jgi:hypothetical protein